MCGAERLDPRDRVFAPPELLRTLPTPCYVYDERGIRARAQRLREAFAWNGGYRAFFPVRATPNPSILRILRQEGQGALCATAGEYRLALGSGFPPEEIRFAPAFPTAAELALPAVDLILDDVGLIPRLEHREVFPARVALRFRPDPHRAYRRAEGSRFGMSRPALFQAARELRLKGVAHIGLTAELGLRPTEPQALSVLAQAMFSLAVELRKRCGVTVDFCDLGGGLPIAQHPPNREPEIGEYGREIRQQFERILVPAGLGGCAVHTGLGRWVTGPCAILLTTVTGIKEGAYLAVDMTRGDLLRPELYGTWHHISLLGDARMDGRRRYGIGDRTPETKEPYGKRLLPECRRGSVLVFHHVGAYGHSMGFRFGSLPRCGEYLYQADGSLRRIRRPEGEDELFATLRDNPDFVPGSDLQQQGS